MDRTFFQKKAETFGFSFINSMNSMARTMILALVPKICPEYCYKILPAIVVLLGKTLVLTAAIASLTLLIQLFPLLNSNFSLGNSFSSYQILLANSTQGTNNTKVNYLSGMPEYLSRLWFSKHHRINKVELPMKINFHQSGGYAGLRMGCELDTNVLSIDEAAQLESLVKTSGILQTKSARSENTADLINYEITIEIKEGKHQVTFDDLTLPESIVPLLDYLQSHATPIR